MSEVPTAARMLIADLAGELGLQGLEFDGDGKIVLRVDGRYLVSLTLDNRQPASVVLFAAVADGVHTRAPVLAAALESSFAWQYSAGATFALEPESKALVLHRRLALDGLDAAAFRAALSAFIAIAVAWAKAAEQGFAMIPDAEPSANPAPLSERFDITSLA